MKRTENLKHFTSDQNRDLARENGKVGGVKSGESRRWRKAVRTFLEGYLSKEAPPELQAQMKYYGVAEPERSNAMALFVAVYAKALEGDPKAASLIFSWSGMLPASEKVETAKLEQYRQTKSEQSRSDSSDVDVIIYDPHSVHPDELQEI